MNSPQKLKPVKKKMHSSDSGDESDRESETPIPPRVQIAARRPSIIAASLRTQHYGSFYLRMGAVGKIN